MSADHHATAAPGGARQTLLDASPDSMLLLDGRGIILEANRAAADRFTTTIAAMLGASIFTFLATDVAEPPGAFLGRLDAEGGFVFVDQRDGVWFENRVTPVTSRDGTIETFAIFARDITARGALEDQASLDREWLSEAADLAKLGYWVWDAIEDRCTYCSEQCARIHGLTPAAYIARAAKIDGALGLTHPEDREQYRARLRALRAGAEIDTEYRILTDAGEVRYVREIAKPICDGGGRVVREHGAILDVTDVKRSAEAMRQAAHRNRSEKALRHSEERYRRLVETMNEGLGILDVDGRFTYVTDRYGQILGYRPEELRGRRVIDLVKPEARANLESQLAARRRGDSTPYEVVHMRKDGGEVVTRVSPQPLIDDKGRFEDSFAVVTDITALRAAEDALRKSQYVLHAMTDETMDAIFVKDREGRYLMVNAATARYLGAAPDAIAGKTNAEIMPAENVATIEAIEAAERAVLETGQPHESEARLTVDGVTRTFLTTRGPCHDDAGALIGVIGVARDITERKRVEEALRESEARFRTIVDNSPAAIFLKDLDGRYRMVNRRFEEWYGIATEDALGKTPQDVFPAHNLDAYELQDHDVLGSGRLVIREQKVPFADGSIHRLEVSKFPVFGDHGEVVGIGIINIERTEQRRIEEQLRQSQKMEVVGQLTGGIAHDFNNRLAVIMGTLGLIGEEAESHQVRDLLSRAIDATDHASVLTRQLLAFSRQQTLSPQAVAVNEQTAKLIELSRRTLGETIDIEMRLDDDMWTAYVDPAQLESALLNLVVNARDAMPSGGEITIVGHNRALDEGHPLLHEDMAAGDYVTIAVGDTGTGIPPEVIEHAFEPFFTTKDVDEGSGLGLSMVYGFVRQSAGNVVIDSAVGRGTTVTIVLPRSDAEAPTKPVQPGASTRGGGGQLILVVEDDPDLQDLTTLVIQGFGYQVCAASSAAEALEVLTARPEIRLLFTDIVLPGGQSGIDLAREARAARPDLPVLYTSGYMGGMANQEQFDEDMQLITKPYRRALLAERLDAILTAAAG